MCAYDNETNSTRMNRRRAAFIASFMSLFTSVWLLVLPRHGESHSFVPLAMGLGVGVALGVGIVALRRRLG